MNKTTTRLTVDDLNRILERYVRTYATNEGVWCLEGPHLAKSVHVTDVGWVACRQHIRQEANR